MISLLSPIELWGLSHLLSIWAPVLLSKWLLVVLLLLDKVEELFLLERMTRVVLLLFRGVGAARIVVGGVRSELHLLLARRLHTSEICVAQAIIEVKELEAVDRFGAIWSLLIQVRIILGHCMHDIIIHLWASVVCALVMHLHIGINLSYLMI